MEVPPSPKQSNSLHKRPWYAYYAGFSQEFVKATLLNDLGAPYYVIDPWSGSGTTSAVCAHLGRASIGVDINPALTVIASARITPVSIRDSLVPLARRLIGYSEDNPAATSLRDPLSKWFQTPTVGRLRSLERAISTSLVEPDNRASNNTLPVLSSFFYVALFATTRQLLTGFASTNPTWIRSSLEQSRLLNPSWSQLSQSFLSHCEYYSRLLSIDNDSYLQPTHPFITGSATSLPFEDGTFDACLTSPPYATRIDYIIATLPELAVLGIDESQVAELRKKSTGTPVVRGNNPVSHTLTSATGLKLLDIVSNHPSKGSRSYYYPWLHKYLVNLRGGLSEASRVVKPEGHLAVVVQDSYYKEHRIDLQTFVTEEMDSLGRELVKERRFAARNLLSRMNPRALAHAPTRMNVESLLVFR